MRARASGREGRVWIAEDSDLQDPMLLTGRFSGHLERDERLEEEFEDLSADEAVAWGRARAPIVLIRAGGMDYCSAGKHNPNPQEFPAWPPVDIRLAPRRVPGFEAPDRTVSDPPVLWDVRVQARVPAEVVQEVGTRLFNAKISAHPAALNVRVPAPGYPPSSAAFLVRASTPGQARHIADAVATDALEALVAGTAKGSMASVSYEVYPHRGDRSVTGPGITY